MKAAAEIFKLASRIGIKPRDIIGQGADVIKMGKSLFNTKVNPKLTEFISTKGKIPTKILEEIKIHLRSLKNASDDQIELFKLNLKDIVNAKPPVASIKQPVTSVKDEAAEVFKGWKPTVIKGGKDKLATGGIAELNAELNQLPEYYLPMVEGGRIGYDEGGIGAWIKEQLKEKKEAIDEYKKEFLERENFDMTVAEWDALPLRQQLKKYYIDANVEFVKEQWDDIKHVFAFSKGGIANHFRKK